MKKNQVVVKKKKLGKKVDPDGEIWNLEQQIGSFGIGGKAFKAVSSSGLLTTLKVVSQHFKDDYDRLQQELTVSHKIPSYFPLVHVEKAFINTTGNFLCVRLPALSSLLSLTQNNPLGEDCIGVVIGQCLDHLKMVHDCDLGYPCFSVDDIFLKLESPTNYISLKIAFSASRYCSKMNQLPIPGWGEGDPQNEKQTVWFVGLAALHLAYGGIPANGMFEMVRKLLKSNKFPERLEDYGAEEKKESGLLGTVMNWIEEKKESGLLGRVMNWIRGFFKPTKEDEGMFSNDFEAIVRSCLSEEEEERPSILEVLEHPYFKKKELYDSTTVEFNSKWHTLKEWNTDILRGYLKD